MVIDNYDSFTYNLVQLVGSSGVAYKVVRNDAISVDGVARMAPQGILISPGPGRPSDAGICMEVIRRLGPVTPILGICLGHQAIARVYGATVMYAPARMHGKTSHIRHNGVELFEGVAQDFVATRYHSLVVAPETVPPVLEVTAVSDDGVIMGLRHREFPVAGVQFHPESVLTTEGPGLISNWMNQVASR